MVLADPKGSVLAPLVETGKMIEAGSWLVEGIGEDFVPPNCDLSLVNDGLYDRRPREPDGGARTAAAGGHPRRLVLGHAARRGAALLPRADRRRSASSPSSATAATSICPRCSTISGWSTRDLIDRPREGDLGDLVARRHAERATVTVGTRRHAPHRLWPHEALRRLAASGPRERQGRRHPRRIGPAAGGGRRRREVRASPSARR